MSARRLPTSKEHGCTRARRSTLAVVTLFALLSGCTASQESGDRDAPPGLDASADAAPGPGVNPLTDQGTRFGLPKEAGNPRPYLSGVWLGGAFNAESLEQFGQWRGSSVETATAYAAYDSWETMPIDWTIWTLRGFDGTLVYGLPLVPNTGPGSLGKVANGDFDHVWRAVAENLSKHGRGKSIVRIGQEANGTWTRWGASAETAEDYKAAFRRVQRILKATSPELLITFDISCGVPLSGSTDRLAPLRDLYPGDDVVDVIGCDVYDETGLHASPSTENPGQNARGPGLLDVLNFAGERGKPMAIPEWGLNANLGSGDNPEFIRMIRGFLDRHGRSIAFENYFNEPGTDLRSSLWKDVQNPAAARVYRTLWGRPAD